MERILPDRTGARPSGRFLPEASRPALSERNLERWALAAIGAVVLGQLLFLLVGCDWELCGDEAEFWAWSRRLDWCYFSGKPLIAWVIRLGTELAGSVSLALTGSLMPAVRLPAVVLGGLTAWGVFRLGQQVCGTARGGLIAVLLLPAVPMFRLGGLLMTAETPFLCCWTWAALWTFRALSGGLARHWWYAGVLGCLGVLGKYTMLAFPASVGLFLLVSPTHRRHLARPGFWIMALGCVLGMVPIVVWNVDHGWVSSGQMAERVGLTSRWNWGRLLPLLGFLAGEVVVLGGVWWFVGVRALASAAGTVRGRDESGAPESERSGLLYLVCLWGVVWSACVVVSLLGESEANWAAPGYVSVVALSGWWLARGAFRNGLTRPASRWGWVGVGFWALSLFNLTALQHTEWFYPALERFVPAGTELTPAPLRRLDPTCRMRGYRAAVPEIERRLAELRSRGENPFVLTPTYTMASALSFYLPGQPEVQCLAFSWTPWRPVTQRDLWHPNPRFDPDAFRGRPMVIVEDAQFHPSYAQALVKLGCATRVEPPTRLLVRKYGVAVAAWDVSNGHNYRGRPGDIR